MAVQEGVRKSGDSERSWGILWNLHLKFIFFTASLRCEKGNEMQGQGGEEEGWGGKKIGSKRWSYEILFPPLFPTPNWEYEERCGTGKEGKFGPQIYLL